LKPLNRPGHRIRNNAPFERGRRTVLAVPLSVEPGLQVVLELFDKRGPGDEVVPFTQADKDLARAAAEFGLIRANAATGSNLLMKYGIIEPTSLLDHSADPAAHPQFTVF